MVEARSGHVIAVDGATGYVGNHLVHTLRAAGHEVRCIVRPGAREQDVEFLLGTGAKVFSTDLDTKSDVLKEALKGCTAAVHLIGSIAPKKGEKLEDLHGGQTEQLVSACKSAEVPKIVLLTALGSSAQADSDYHRTKAQSEQIVSKCGLNFVVLRPSLILGRVVGTRDSKLVARYRKMIEEKNSVPLINGGGNKLQPVFVGDLSSALMMAATSEVADGKIVEIGGAEVITMREFVTLLMESLKKHKQIKAIPAGLVSLAAGVLEIFQPVPLVSKDQVRLACKDNICADNGLRTVFNIEPVPCKTALASYARSVAAAGKAQTAAGQV